MGSERIPFNRKLVKFRSIESAGKRIENNDHVEHSKNCLFICLFNFVFGWKIKWNYSGKSIRTKRKSKQNERKKENKQLKLQQQQHRFQAINVNGKTFTFLILIETKGELNILCCVQSEYCLPKSVSHEMANKTWNISILFLLVKQIILSGLASEKSYFDQKNEWNHQKPSISIDIFLTQSIFIVE